MLQAISAPTSAMGSEVWVGPIAALYRGPGPKYKLPTNTGSKGGCRGGNWEGGTVGGLHWCQEAKELENCARSKKGGQKIRGSVRELRW